MDRDRLGKIEQSDLSESNLNEDFVDWLKTAGPTYLLVVLVIIAGYLGWIRWQSSKVNYRQQAWTAFQEADLPGPLEDVAAEYDDVGSIATMARLRAASRLMRSVQAGTQLGALPDPGTDAQSPAELPELSAEQRDEYLQRADRLYQEVIERDRGTLGDALHTIAAYNGKAAVAEARGDFESARSHYEDAAERAEPHYPALAAQANRRIETLDAIDTSIALPTDADVQRSGANANQPPRSGRPLAPNPALDRLIFPEDYPDQSS